MPKRDTVRPNINSIAEKVSDKKWSEASFSQMVGKHKRWLSEVRRGKNLPSPEEAAKMCVLLQTTPEEILVEQDDIDLVNALLDNEMAKEKAPGQEAEGMNAEEQEIWNYIKTASKDEIAEVSRYIKYLESKREPK